MAERPSLWEYWKEPARRHSIHVVSTGFEIASSVLVLALLLLSITVAGWLIKWLVPNPELIGGIGLTAIIRLVDLACVVAWGLVSLFKFLLVLVGLDNGGWHDA